MKMNSLVDRRCIRALYRASQAGVRIDLNIRGICCLVPGVPGVSENIRVNSVVGRFLEHSRIFAFERDGETTVYIGSADLMPRNLDTRVELDAPVEDPVLRDDLLDTLERSLADDDERVGPRRRRRLGAPRAGRRAALRAGRADGRTRRARRRGAAERLGKAPCRGRFCRKRAEHVLAVATAVIRRRRVLAALALLALAALVFGIVSGRGSDPGRCAGRARRARGRPASSRCSTARWSTGPRRRLRVRSTDVRVVDGDGKRLTSSAAFSGGYVPAFAGGAPRGDGHAAPRRASWRSASRGPATPRRSAWPARRSPCRSSGRRVGSGRVPARPVGGRHPHPRADARQPPPGAAARGRQRRRAGQGVVARGRRQRPAPGA